MDKNTITGLVLIGILLIGFSYLSRPSTEEQIASKHYNDSIATLRQREEDLKAKTTAALANEQKEEATALDSTSTFFKSSTGVEEFTTIENDLLKVTITNKGAYASTALLKEYNGQDKKPLVLFSDDDAAMNFFFYNKKEAIQSKNYYFEAVNRTDSSVTMRLAADSTSYIDFIYALHPGNYMMDFSIKASGMENILSSTTKYVDMEWSQRARQLERGFTYENRLSNLTYKLTGDNSDNLSTSKSEEKAIPQRLDWVAFKNQFFSSVFIADKCFNKSTLKTKTELQGSGYLKDYSAELSTPFDPKGVTATTMHLYFGPNHYKTLKSYDRGRTEKWELDNLVYLGWPVVRSINKWFTINIFDWLSSWGLSMGIVLLLMTIIVKVVVFPATWKTYISSAKMRVLKPQIDVINKKYPKQEDAMKKQQEVMALYSQYGVSPMGGCLPMLLQFPILMALFMFVPSAIELRQQSFLWADDLSTYDAIVTFPFHVPFLGTHLSLFCLLMTATNILNTKFTMSQQDTGQQQMAAMKWMMYLMPLMFLFVLNDYPAGLNYYYFISTLISVVTMIVLRRVTDEDKLLAQLETKKAKPKKKKTGFAARLETMQKNQQRVIEERSKQKK
ncbi:membrane protein insertase YidC [uncultured Bacteroides sp.]|uniref:membrane protein insertase YidC n=1 Tax=uncultured Bacteroides sp. TaxID=162156 RepID=UPI002AA79F8B|nr:membrane protein insertase YidC [uncultured Bacteroides sp.]